MTATTAQSAMRGTGKRSAGLAASLIALAAGIVGVTAPEAGAEPGGWYNVRSGPGLDYPVIAQAYEPNCTALEGFGVVRADGYVFNRVRVDGQLGWMYNDGWCH